jgi:hydrogenase maturation protein HypF
MLSAVDAAVRGRVQGVGFRPFVFQIAQLHQVKGTVQNNMDGVKIHIEGEQENITAFLSDLSRESPRLSKINEITVQPSILMNHKDFSIIPSERSGASMLVLPVDSAVCEDCLEEMNDSDNFRYQYPFINCTQCGPRYTIISDLPYDRPFTSMKAFPMCPDCKKEYEDPTNRRHHAQPIACPKCGPSVKLHNHEGEIDCSSPLIKVKELLMSGSIVAVKGLGGYHLCCDAGNEETVALLRKRKKRPSRPLAIMARDINAVDEIAHVSSSEREVLQSPESPIVVLRKRHSKAISESVAPGMETIGVMLPYTPLHHLLFKDCDLDYVVMTSANPSGQPILYNEGHAFQYLMGIADYFLLHDREILHPADDSVMQLSGNQIDFFRRSRGYVPDPLNSAEDVNGIVAFGGQQKTTFTIGRHHQIFVGPHIGDLENIETIEHYKKELNHLLNWIHIPYKTGVIDLHPGFNTREILKKYPFEEIIEIQHHHAHMAACMADNGITDDVWGIILDGTGYGSDGNVWGFEIFHGNVEKYERKAHLRYTPLPGGERAVREPWRNAAAMLMDLLGDEGAALANELFPQRKTELAIIRTIIEKNINSPYAGTCGRLFDAVSAICGIGEISTYDGEAAIQFSELVQGISRQGEVYPFEIRKDMDLLVFDFSLMIKKIARDHLNGMEAKKISLNFHETVVQAIVKGMEHLQNQSDKGTRKVVLSGGSFHNTYLHSRVKAELDIKGLEVYSHQRIPCNDGGLSFGQLIVAAARRRKR